MTRYVSEVDCLARARTIYFCVFVFPSLKSCSTGFTQYKGVKGVEIQFICVFWKALAHKSNGKQTKSSRLDFGKCKRRCDRDLIPQAASSFSTFKFPQF